MPLLSRGKDPRLSKILAKYRDAPDKITKENQKTIKEMAVLIKEMADTRGWKEIVYPVLESHGNPALLFGKSPEEYAKLSPKVNAYYNLKSIVDSLLRFLEEEPED